MATASRGFFVTLEGVDGAGKSTQAARLAAHLRGRGIGVVETREPGGSEGAEAIRALLLGGEAGRWSATTEMLLFTAARRDHVERTIAPALAEGRAVVCDRYVDSTRAYQGAGDPHAAAEVDVLHARMIGLDPHLTVLLDLDPAEAAHRRAGAGADRFEARGLAFQVRLAAHFRAIAAAEPARIAVIDAARPPDAVAAEIAAAADARLAAG